MADHAEVKSTDTYTPVFSVSVRKAVYIFGLLCTSCAGVMTLIATMDGAPKWVAITGACITLVGGNIAHGFGVAYAGKSE